MVRPITFKNGWFATITALALVIWAISFSMGITRVCDEPGSRGSRTGDLARPADGLMAALDSAMPDEARVESAHADFIENEEEESSCSFGEHRLTSLHASEWPSQAPSDPHPGHRPCRIIATPLRC